jgi:hypothetical protein
VLARYYQKRREQLPLPRRATVRRGSAGQYRQVSAQAAKSPEVQPLVRAAVMVAALVPVVVL